MKAYNYLVFTGPESSGKSTLVHWLCQKYSLPSNPEYARIYLSSLQRKYTKEDVIFMAEQQIKSEGKSERPWVCDTDLLTYLIWLEVVYGISMPDWAEIVREQCDRYYFLLKPDIPWEPDPLRENPDNRDELFDLYLDKLKIFELPYVIVEGEGEKRKKAVEENFLKIFS